MQRPVKELLTHGVVTVNDDDAAILNAMEILQRRLQEQQVHAKSLEVANDRLSVRTEYLEKENSELLPKADYTDEVLSSASTYTLTQTAHDLGMRSVHVFTDWCVKKGILYKQSGQWQPTAKVAALGYFKTRTYTYVKADGTPCTSLLTGVTETGRKWLHELVKKEKSEKVLQPQNA